MKNQATLNAKFDRGIEDLQEEVKKMLIKVAGVVGGISAAGVFATIIVEILKH